MSKYAKMVSEARKSPHYWAQAAWREFQSQILPVPHDGPNTYKEMAKRRGISTQEYCAILRHNNLSIQTMSRLAANQGKRIRIIVEPMP